MNVQKVRSKISTYMKISIAFYKGKGNILNKIVRVWTKSRYSHAELILDDEKTWISISPKLGSKIANTVPLLVDHTQWDIIELQVDEGQYQTILEFYDETAGCGYDWIGMLCSQFLPFRIKARNRWYCSEWIAYALRIACIIDWKIIKIYDRKDLSPGVLHNIVQKVKEDEDKKV